jgi:hypothetical protein
MQRREGKGGGRLRGECYFRVRKHSFYSCFFFFNCWVVEPVRFGSVQSVSDFRNRNRTEPEFFCDFLIG